jgi:hypothetical protein
MKYLNKFFLLLLIPSLFYSSCSKHWLDVNDDPNRATENTITPQLIFTGAEVATGFTGAVQTSDNFLFLNHWMGYVAPNGDFAPNFKEQTYDLDFNFGDVLWQNYYNVLFDLHQAKTKSLVPGGDSVLAGASMILSAKLFQDLVDLFGDIPYSQAFQVKQNPTPAYDKAQDIYNSLMLSLDTAIGYMKLTPLKSFANVDVINGGDKGKWARFANTLKLRLLLRQSEISGFNPTAELTKIQNDGGILQDGESISVNPGFVNDVNKQQSFYSAYGYTPVGNKATTSDNANAYIVNILNSSADPRLGRFFQPVGSSFVGNVYGDKQSDIPSGASSSYFGPGLIGEGLDDGTGATRDQWILPSFENMFFKAEAIARGWDIGATEDVRTAYENAVTESFVWLGVPDATTAAENYYSSEDNTYANWDFAGTSVADQVRFIVFQKYIALTCIDPLEAYSDQRRLHFLPDNGYISKNSARLSNTLPLRLPYPQTEYTTNSTNVLAEGDIDPLTTKIFWEP